MGQTHGQGAGRSNSSKSNSEKSRKDWFHRGGTAPCAKGWPKARHGLANPMPPWWAAQW